ncbi:MAG TPA: NAD(P)-dependent oxidoreductase [Motilibacteraceae bacterium]|nr:NAD(P)-dependent oxidoreductase [Motilibacteraceae bacterium]
MDKSTDSMNVAFLGLGRMGAAMARHVLDAGHSLTVWNRSPGKADALVGAGAKEAATPAEAARDADVVVLMLFGPDSVREVLLGDDGVVQTAREGTLVVDATTIGPAATREFADAVGQHGLRYLDAPVAGTVGPATEGTLGVFVGGADDDVAQARPLLEAWGDPQKVLHLGPVGAGSALKLVVNLALGITAEGVGEALRLAADLGVDRGAALKALGAGPFGWFLNQKGAMVESGSYSPTAFSLDLAAKDVDLAVSSASRELPASAAALAQLRAASVAGRGDDDYASLVGFLLEG